MLHRAEKVDVVYYKNETGKADWINLAQDRDQWRDLVNRTMHLPMLRIFRADGQLLAP
jgi:hypothetical protein